MKAGSPALVGVARAVVALLSSCALWLVVGGNERAATWVPVKVEIASRDTDMGDVTVVPFAPPTPVRAYINGRRRDFLRLLQSPPVLQRAVFGGGSDSLRLELRPIDVTLPNGTDARVSDIHPRAIVVPLDPPRS